MAEVKSSTNDPVLPIVTSTYESRDHTVKDFLNRVYVIDNLVWDKSYAQGAILGTYRFPDVLLSQPALAAKIRNFFGLRAGVEFIVLINRQPFQAGNLLISYLPGAKYNTAKTAMSSASLTTRTGMTRTNLDLMSASLATISVPYVSPHVYYNLLTNEGTIGDFTISVYSELTDVSDTGTVSIQVQARFVDVDPEFPTGSLPSTTSDIVPVVRLVEDLKLLPSIETLKELKKVVNKLIKREDIELQMNDTINTFNVKPKALPNMSVINSNNSHVLSLFNRNVLPPVNLGGNLDEMSILRAVSVPCYHDSFTVSNESAQTNVWNKLVHPKIPASTNVDGTINVDYVYYHALPFSKWSGSFVYTFKVVKTRFHSLRLRVWFSPASSTVAGIDRNACISKIVDLKEENEFQFVVPYIWPHPKLNVHYEPQSLGIIGVDIVNPMVYPSTVAPNVQVIVERAAGPDFKVNLPVPLRAFPSVPNPVERRNEKIDRRKGEELIEYEPIVGELVDIVPYGAEDPHKLLVENIIRSNKFNDVSKAVKYAESLPLQNVNGLNWLSSIDELNASSLILPIGLILKKLKENKMHILTKRSESDYLRDLTREGIESNPGPTEILTGVINSSIPSVTLTSALISPVYVRISLTHYLGSEDIVSVTLSGAVSTVVLPVTKFASNVFDFVLDTNTPSFTFDIGTVGTSSVWISLTCSNEIPRAYVTNTPLPVEVVAGTESIVTKTSIDLQINTHEQDEERNPHHFERPIQSRNADDLCLGQEITHINQMFNRSGLVFSGGEQEATNLVTILPHMFGILSDTSNNATDILSYYASSYGFARGGINLRFVTAPDFAFNVVLGADQILNPSGPIPFASASLEPANFNTALGGALQQVIKPDLEGFGEVTIPFYSDSYMYYIDNVLTQDSQLALRNLQLPYTTVYLSLFGNLNNVNIYRAASSDFEMSFLTGPPVLRTVL